MNNCTPIHLYPVGMHKNSEFFCWLKIKKKTVLKSHNTGCMGVNTIYYINRDEDVLFLVLSLNNNATKSETHIIQLLSRIT